MKCTKCGFENIDKAKFCNECGAYFITALKASRQVISFDEKIAKIQRYLPINLIEKILSQRDKIEGELKQVTVMFCDMEKFMALSERLGTEDSYAVMDLIYKILIHQVHRYEGTVNEMTGDGIMALFGAPIALEDAPQKALLSALSIHREIAKFNRQQKGRFSIKMRIGINTGPVVVGTLGNDLRVEFKAVGDTVNLASRMEGLSEPGTTCVTQKTFKLTKSFFEYDFLGKKYVKGKEAPIHVYKLLSRKEDIYRFHLGSERLIYSTMVGRDSELDLLEFQVRKAINGKGAIVNIIGEAGIGKSRLVAELKKRDVMKQVAFFEGRAISIGRNLSFYPIIDLLKQWAQIGEDDGEGMAYGKLEAAVRNLYPEKATEILPFVATLMSMKLSGRYAERVKGIEGESLEKLILKNIRQLIIRATELSPLVIIAEDLQWADTSTIEIMEQLFNLAETQRILFINLFRPNHPETGDRISANLKKYLSTYSVEIVLEPLDETTSIEMIDNMLNIIEFKHTIADKIVERAGGNPFFIEEVVQSFIDERVVVFENGRYKATEKIDETVIPNRIVDVLMARIDRLDEETRNLIKVASVIGRNFFYRIIKEVAKFTDDIDNRLSYLKEMQLIRERKKKEEVEYYFKHALAQEVVYESILKKNRRRLHLNVAQAIEKNYDERLYEFYGMLAYHYGRAEDLDKAENYLVKAGEEALRSSASSEALKYYQEAMTLYLKKTGSGADPEKLSSFEKNIALAFYNKGQLEDAIEYFERVLERWGVGSPKNNIIITIRIIFNLLSVIFNLYFPSKKVKKFAEKREMEIFDFRYKKAVSLVHLDPEKCFTEFLGTLNKLSKFDITKIENGIGMWMSGSGLFSWTGISFRLSKKMLDYNKDHINKNDFREVLYFNLFDLLYKTLVGSWSEVKNYDENLVELNLRFGEFWHTSTYLLFHGYIELGQGAFKNAQLKIEKLYEISVDYGNQNGTEYWYTLKIILSINYRKYSEALKEVDKGITFLLKTGRETVVIYYLGLKSIIQVLKKDLKNAEETLRQAQKLASKQNRLLPIYISSYLLGQFLYNLEILEMAISANDKLKIRKYRKMTYENGKRAIKNSKKYAFDRTEVLKLMGVYYWLVGKHYKAVGLWTKAINEAERLGARVQLARIYAEMGIRLGEAKKIDFKLEHIKADECLEKARIIFHDMGLVEDLNQLNC